MSDQQRQITKYIHRLTTPTLVAYIFHLLDLDLDEGSQQMVHQTLTDLATQTHNTQILSAMHDRTKKFWKGKVDKYTSTSSRREKDYEQRAVSLMNWLYLEPALTLFTKQKRSATHEQRNDTVLAYKCRAEINLVMGNYAEAFSLAQKGHFPDLTFVSAIASGDLEEAANLIPAMLSFADSRVEQTGVAVVSAFEALHLIILVSLAVKTSEEVKRLIPEVVIRSGYDLGKIIEMGTLFGERRFGELVALFGDIRSMLNFSLYTKHVSDSIMFLIRRNVVVNASRPYSRISFRELEEMTGIRSIHTLLLAAISDNKIQGQVDMVAECFFGNDDMIEMIEMTRIMNETMVIREVLELTQMRETYTKMVTK